MALTKAQVSLVTVATLGAAPGGFTADLLNFGSQVEVAALALSVSPTQAAQTNAEFALQVAKNLGATDALSLYKALEAGTSRADAVVDFANAQLVAQGGNIAKVKAAEASNSTSTDLTELVAVVTPKATAATDATIIEFKDNNGSAGNAHNGATDTTGTPIVTEQTIAYVGKDQIINGKATKVAADFTFQLKDQIGEDDQYNGKFLSPILDRKAADNTGSQVILELRNLREDVESVEPLKSLPTNGIAFTLNGALLKIADADQGTNKAIDNALTYDDLRTALENRLAELARGENLPDGASGESTDPAAYAQLASFTVEKGGLFTAQNEKGDSVTGNQIVLTDKAGATLEPLAFTQSSDIIIGSGYTLYGELKKEDAKPITKLITTNLDADNVGYGSQGASVNLAGQSASNKGVEEIKVLATNGVWFTKLESKAATNHLQRVELKSGSEGYFRVGTQENSPNHVVSLVDQDFSKGGLVDVQQVEAGNVAGSTAINSFVSSNVLGRYTFKDFGKFDADESNITYNLSSGRDVLNLAIDTKVLAAVDTQVNVNTGAGDDVITVMATNSLGSKKTAAIFGTDWLVDQQLNDNIKIDAGAGNDWILTPGAGNATILAGAGNDVVRVDNTGDRGVFVFNNATTDINMLKLNQGLDSNSDKGLSAGANGLAQTFDFYKAVVKVTFKGFESKYITIDSNNYTTTTKQINQAIKKAINDDAVLSKLIAAHDNEGNALAIESLIDGTLALTDLNIEIQGPAAYSTTQADIDAAKAAGKVMLANGEAAKADAAYLADGKTSTTASIDTTFAEGLYETEFAASPGTPGYTMTSVTGVENTDGNTEVLEEQTLDLSGVTVAVGETMTFTIDGTDYTYTNSAVAPLAGADLVDALVSDLLVTDYTVTKSGTTATDLVITQDAGNGSSITAITTAIDTPSSTVASVTGATSGSQGAPAVAEVLAEQTFDFSAVTAVTDGETVTITIDSQVFTFTATAVTEAGAAFAATIDSTTSGNYTAVVSGATVTITQNAGFGATIGAATIGGTATAAVAAVVDDVVEAGAAAVAEQLEAQNLDLTSVTVAAGGDMIFTIDGETIDYTNSGTTDLTGSDLVDDIVSTLGTTAVGTAAGNYEFSGTTTTLTITQAVGNGSDIADITTDIVTPSSTVASVSGVEDVDGDTEVLEVQTLNLSGVTVAAGGSMNFIIDGQTITYNNSTASALAGADLVDALVSDLTVTGYAVTKDTTVGTNLVITQSAGNGSDILPIATAIVTPATFIPHNGSNSWAESDNVIDLGAGQDVLVLGTGAQSNDTVVFKNYNLGEKTIVNFTTGTGTGADLLDFTSYLNSVDATTKAVIDNTVASDFSTTNGVTLVTFTAGANTVDSTATTVKHLTFDELTEANVKLLLNNANAAGDIKGVGGLSATEANNNVLMVQSDTNAGEYKAFHVTTGATSATADVKLIGTFDFGDTNITGLATVDLV